MEERIDVEASPEQAQNLWLATYLLMGLNHSKDFVNSLFKGVHRMQDSTTYQAILRGRKGMAKGKGRGSQADSCCGWVENSSENPIPRSRRKSTRFLSLVEIERLTDRLLDVSSWDELMVES